MRKLRDLFSRLVMKPKYLLISRSAGARAKAGADVLQLEKFTPADVAAGADFLVTSAPNTAPPRDVEVSFVAC